MITILLKNPKLFSFLDKKLTNEEIKLILKEKNYKFLVDSIPLRLFDLEKLDIEIFYKLLEQPNFIRFIANFIQTNLEIDVIETLNNRIKNINDISLIEFFFTLKLEKKVPSFRVVMNFPNLLSNYIIFYLSLRLKSYNSFNIYFYKYYFSYFFKRRLFYDCFYGL